MLVTGLKPETKGRKGGPICSTRISPDIRQSGTFGDVLMFFTGNRDDRKEQRYGTSVKK